MKENDKAQERGHKREENQSEGERERRQAHQTGMSTMTVTTTIYHTSSRSPACSSCLPACPPALIAFLPVGVFANVALLTGLLPDALKRLRHSCGPSKPFHIGRDVDVAGAVEDIAVIPVYRCCWCT